MLEHLGPPEARAAVVAQVERVPLEGSRIPDLRECHSIGLWAGDWVT